jgi:hypothetical protein
LDTVVLQGGVIQVHGSEYQKEIYLFEAGMWFPCWIRSSLMWMHWDMTNLNN